MNLTRRETLSLAAAAAVAGITLPSLAYAKDGDTIDQLKLMAPMAIPDKVIGDPNAKVTLIEYLSPTCPHCALVANTVIGPFEDKYVKTGKVKFIPRPFARNTLDVAIFLLAEAAARSVDAQAQPAGASSAMVDASAASAPAPAAPTSYSPAAALAWENVINTFYKTQGTWGASDKPLDAVKAVAFQLGFNDDTFNAALKDQALFDAVNTMRDQAVTDFGLEGTPTFYLNGKQMEGERTLDQLSQAIDPLLQ